MITGRERANELHSWIERIKARLLHQFDVNPIARRFSVYIVNGQTFITKEHLHAGGWGWDIFVTASNSNNIKLTLSAASAALNIDEEGNSL